MFIFAERIGDWESHFDPTRRMLNLFAATGHYHYAKCGRMYLQQMFELPSNYPSIYNFFKENGYHTIRRSNRYWPGFWSDLVIEQVMMKSIKSRAGRTRGRGMNERVRHQWVHTNHACAAIHNAMTKIVSKFGQCAVVFDGYEGGPSTKDHEHCRRSVKNRGTVEFIFNEEAKVKVNQEAFISNEKNKTRFIKMHSKFLTASRQTVRNCKDADTEIVKCAIDFAEQWDVNMVADDTDAALMLFHWKPLLHEITFTSEKKS